MDSASARVVEVVSGHLVRIIVPTGKSVMNEMTSTNEMSQASLANQKLHFLLNNN